MAHPRTRAEELWQNEVADKLDQMAAALRRHENIQITWSVECIDYSPPGKYVQNFLFISDRPAATRVVHCKREGYDVYIGRPGKWGNPIPLRGESSRQAVLTEYRCWLQGNIPELIAKYGKPPLLSDIKAELKGKILGCWCSPKPCHGDILAELANSEF